MQLAGTFYPATKEKIIAFLKTWSEKNKEKLNNLSNIENISGILVPHAGWIYSGETAFLAHYILSKIKSEKIAVIGPSHNFAYYGVVQDQFSEYETPLGNLTTIHEPIFVPNNEICSIEHSVEVQYPFIKYFSPTSKVMTLVTGELNQKDARKIAEHLINKEYFLIISSDLSHYLPLPQATKIDEKTINNILNLIPKNLEACGRNPIKIMIEAAKLLKKKPKLIKYSTSADTTGDTSQVVGYASMYF